MKLYSPDLELPGCELLFDIRRLQEQMSGWLTERGIVIESIANIRYKPRTSCLVSYQIASKATPMFLHAKAFRRVDWSLRQRKFTDDDRCWTDNRNAVAVFCFPLDRELPALNRLYSDPESFLSSVMFNGQSEGRIERMTTLAYKPNRRYVAKIGFSNGEQFVLKLHDPSTFPEVMATAQAIKSLEAELPQRVGRSNRHGAIIHRWIDGEPIDLDVSCRATVKEQTTEISECAFRLHQLGVGSTLRLGKFNSLAGIKAMAMTVAELCPPAESLAHRIAGYLVREMPKASEPRLIHGDFHEGQLIAGPDRIRACDFDNCCLGDETVDLANFVGHLHFRAVAERRKQLPVGHVDAVFIRQLTSRFGPRSLERYRWNVVASQFRLASHFFRQGSENWSERTVDYLTGMVGQIEAASTTRQHSAASRGKVLSKRKMFSADAALDRVQPAFEPGIANRVLHCEVPRLTEMFGRYDVNDVSLIRHKPGRRCLIEIELQTEVGPKFILGKASARKLDSRSFQTQENLFNSFGFGYDSDDRVSVARPIGICRPWQMWFQEKIEATSGGDLLESGRLSLATRAIGESLAKLHRSELSPRRHHSLVDEIGILGRQLGEVVCQPAVESRIIDDVFASCLDLASRVSQVAPVPIHRDFYQDQILFAPGRTFLVDLDLVALGHPAIDVGNFLAHLVEHSIRCFGNATHWAREEREIVSHYLELNSIGRMDIQICRALSLARHISISRRISGRTATTMAILSATEQALGECWDACGGRRMARSSGEMR